MLACFLLSGVYADVNCVCVRVNVLVLVLVRLRPEYALHSLEAISLRGHRCVSRSRVATPDSDSDSGSTGQSEDSLSGSGSDEARSLEPDLGSSRGPHGREAGTGRDARDGWVSEGLGAACDARLRSKAMVLRMTQAQARHERCSGASAVSQHGSGDLLREDLGSRLSEPEVPEPSPRFHWKKADGDGHASHLRV